MRIPIIPCSMKKQFIEEDNIQKDQCYLEILDDLIIYSLSFFSEVWQDDDDESLGKKSQMTKHYSKIKKEKIIGVEISWNDYNKKWNVTITAGGMTFELYVRKESEAHNIFDQVDKWLFKKLECDNGGCSNSPTNY